MSDKTPEQRIGEWILGVAKTVDEIAEISGLIVEIKREELRRGIIMGVESVSESEGGES